MAVDDIYTKLLLHMDGADNGTTFTDEAGHTLTPVGNACTKTAVKKFGSASAYFDGNGDYITSPASDDFAFGTGQFTVDMWIRFHTVKSYNEFFRMATDFNTGRFVLWFNGTLLQAVAGGGNSPTTISWTPTANQWYHLAVSRDSSNNQRIFIDGELIGSAVSNNNYSQSGITLGYGYDSSWFDGEIDELRISNGIARWVGNFTPPTSEYSSSLNVTVVQTLGYSSAISLIPSILATKEILILGGIGEASANAYINSVSTTSTATIIASVLTSSATFIIPGINIDENYCIINPTIIMSIADIIPPEINFIILNGRHFQKKIENHKRVFQLSDRKDVIFDEINKKIF